MANTCVLDALQRLDQLIAELEEAGANGRWIAELIDARAALRRANEGRRYDLDTSDPEAVRVRLRLNGEVIHTVQVPFGLTDNSDPEDVADARAEALDEAHTIGYDYLDNGLEAVIGPTAP